MNDYFSRLDLTQNPFPAAASGLGGVLNHKAYCPPTLEAQIENFYNDMVTNAHGVRIFPIIGNYGSGKTALLNGYLRFFFEEKNIKVIYFDNPGVEFYDLADTLMRSLGRYEFAKALWELSKPFLAEREKQPRLFNTTFEDELATLSNQASISKKIQDFQYVIKNNLNLTDDEEVAAKLGMLVVETKKKTYFDARDFEIRNNSLAPQHQEARFFSAIIRAIIQIYNVSGVAFLIDEFEEIAISETISKQKQYAYLTTLRKLIDFATLESLWIAISMTDSARDMVITKNQALWQRFSNAGHSTIELVPFSADEIKAWLIWWLNRYRMDKEKSIHYNTIYPFSKNFFEVFIKDASRCVPRRLVKAFFHILAAAKADDIAPDNFSVDFISSVVDKVFPLEEEK